jgi:hypothetical protein
MIVHRDEKAVEEVEVELTKKSGKGSGLCLIGYKSGKGAYVSEVVRYRRVFTRWNFTRLCIMLLKLIIL